MRIHSSAQRDGPESRCRERPLESYPTCTYQVGMYEDRESRGPEGSRARGLEGNLSISFIGQTPGDTGKHLILTHMSDCLITMSHRSALIEPQHLLERTRICLDSSITSTEIVFEASYFLSVSDTSDDLGNDFSSIITVKSSTITPRHCGIEMPAAGFSPDNDQSLARASIW